MLARAGHQFFDAITVASARNDNAFQCASAFQRFANGMNSCETIHISFR
jgi:hypothetical protein